MCLTSGRQSCSCLRTSLRPRCSISRWIGCTDWPQSNTIMTLLLSPCDSLSLSYIISTSLSLFLSLILLLAVQLDKHRPIVLLFFELLSSYYRVLALLGLIQERKSVFALYTTANSLASEATDVVGVSEYVATLSSGSLFPLALFLLLSPSFSLHCCCVVLC